MNDISLHKQFYILRDNVWKELEWVVRHGCTFVGDFPIVVGELHLSAVKDRSATIIADTTSIVIWGIVKNENYSIHPPKESDNDLNIVTNKITVILKQRETREVEPDLMDLQELATYVSGGFSAYTK